MFKLISSAALCTIASASGQQENATFRPSRKLSGRVVADFNGGKCRLRKVTPDRLVSEILGPVMRRTRFSRPSVWEKTNLPKSMRGIWWHSYTTTVNTFLHNRPAQLKNEKLISTVHVKNANVWSAKDTPLVCGEGCKGTDQQGISDYKNNRRGDFKYTFHFSKLPGSREYNWAEITPALGSFAMGKDTHSPQCGYHDARSNPDAGKASVNPIPTSDLTFAQKRTRRCGRDEVWRRYTKFVGSVKEGETDKPTIGFTYDVIKIVDQYGDKIQPNFDNWVSALKKKGQSHILLPEGDC